MTLFAKIKNDQVVQYPYTILDLHTENPSTSYGDLADPSVIFDETTPALLNGWTLAAVARAPQPAIDAATQRASEAMPALIDGAWTQVWQVEDIPLSEARARKREELTARCAEQIVAGFRSQALGEEHEYPSTLVDQQNMSANVMSSLLPGIAPDWHTLQLCADPGGVWAYRPHSAAQIQQVGRDGKDAIMAALQKKALLFHRLDTALTGDELRQIVWG